MFYPVETIESKVARLESQVAALTAALEQLRQEHETHEHYTSTNRSKALCEKNRTSSHSVIY